MSLELFQPTEVRALYGIKNGSDLGKSSPGFISTSGISLATGVTAVTNCAYQLFSAHVHFLAEVSSGVSLVLSHPGGINYNTLIDFTKLTNERHCSFIPTAPLILPTGSSVRLITGPTNVAGSTRYMTLVIGF